MPRWVSVQVLVDEAGLAAVLELAGQSSSPAELVGAEVARLRKAKADAEAARQREAGDGEPERPTSRIVLRDLDGRWHVDMADPVAISWQAGLAARVAELAAQAETAMAASRQPPVSELDQAALDQAALESAGTVSP
jgi:hypothetical protein